VKISFSDKQLEILKIRLRYLKNLTKNLQICSILFVVSVFIIIIFKWIIIVPFFDRLFLLAQSGDVEHLQNEIKNMPPLIRYAPIALSIALFSLTVGIGILSLVIHKISKIEYKMSLDLSRLLMFFATVMCGLSAVLWAILGRSFLASNIDDVAGLVGPLYYSERMFRLCFSVSFIFLMISFYQLKKILVNIININSHILLAFLILGFLSIIDIFLAVPFFIYSAFRKRIVYGFAYVGIYKNK